MKRLAAVLALSALGCVSTTTSAPTVNPTAYNATIAEAATKHMEQNERLQDVWFRLTTANYGLCQKRRPISGFSIADLATAPQPYRSAWLARFGPSEYVTVVHVAAGSPAYQAGLRAGDRIVDREGQEVGTRKRALRRIQRQPGSQPYTMTVLRGGERVALSLRSVGACDYSAGLLEYPEVNAFADGKAVAVTTAAMDFIGTDEELAYLLGHELAHNGYGHLAAVKQNRIVGALLGAVVTVATGVYQDYSNLGALYHAPKFEVEADYAGVYMAARAGYDVGCVSTFWQKMIARNPSAAWAESLTHPDGSSRLHVLDATAAEIHHKRNNGQRLSPNLRGELDAGIAVDVEAYLAGTNCASESPTSNPQDLQVAACQSIAAGHVVAIETTQKVLKIQKPSEAQCTMYRAQQTFCTSALEHCSDEERSKCAAWGDLVAEHCD